MNQPWALYDLVEDPSEAKVLAKQHPKIVAELSEKFETRQASCEQSDQGNDY